MNTRKKFQTVHWLAWLAFGVLIVVVNRYTNTDIVLSDWMFDTSLGMFPLKQSHLFGIVFHEGLRWLSVAMWLGLPFFTFFQNKSNRHWNEVSYVMLVSLICAVAVSGLKSFSMHSCPWDLTTYGGSAQYFRLFESVDPVNTGPGRCFPSGHASTALMWIVLLYSPLPWFNQHKNMVALLVLGFGAIAAVSQIAKGAHFLSHVMATAWVCWGVTLCAEGLRTIRDQRRESAHLT